MWEGAGPSLRERERERERERARGGNFCRLLRMCQRYSAFGRQELEISNSTVTGGLWGCSGIWVEGCNVGT
jgi:hypothetical protein